MVSRRSLIKALGAGALGATAIPLSACSKGPSSGGDGPVSLYSWRQEDTEGYTKIFEAFTAKNPDVKVKFEPFNATDYDQILQTALKSGDKLDIFQLRPFPKGKVIIDQGQNEPLNDLPGLSDFSDEYLDAARGADGDVYGVPLALNAHLTLYNVDLFKKHKVKVPQTWPEFLDACAKLKKAGLTPIAQTGKASYLLGIMYNGVSQAAMSDQFTKDALDGKADFTGPEFTKSVQRVLDLKPYFPDNFVGMVDEEARTMFTQGESAMYINGDYRTAPLLEMNPDLKIDYIPSLPDSGSEVRIFKSVDGSYGVLAESEHLDQSKKLLAYMTTSEFGTAFSKTFSRLSPVPGTEPADTFHKELSADVEDHGVSGVLSLLAGGEPDVGETFNNALQGVYSGQVSLDKLLQDTQDAYQASQANK